MKKDIPKFHNTYANNYMNIVINIAFFPFRFENKLFSRGSFHPHITKTLALAISQLAIGYRLASRYPIQVEISEAK